MTIHPATGRAPSEVLMGRQLRSTLDIIKTEKEEVPYNRYREEIKSQHDKRARQTLDKKFNSGTTLRQGKNEFPEL